MSIHVNSGMSFLIGVVSVALLAVLKGTCMCDMPFEVAAGIISGLTVTHMTKRVVDKKING